MPDGGPPTEEIRKIRGKFNVTIVDDGAEEPLHERFELQLAFESGDATLGAPARIQFTILDDDGDNLFADGFES